MWREADSGATKLTSDSLTATSYPIEQLKSATNYSITVTATNPAGSTDSLPVFISTGTVRVQSILHALLHTLGSDSCPEVESCDCMSAVTDDTAAIIGAVVAVVLILSVSLTVIAIVILLRNRHSTSVEHKR